MSIILHCDTGSIFHGFYSEYLLDSSTLSSYSYDYGFSTELNAYTHGLEVEARLKRNLSLSNPVSQIMGQRYGIIFFLTMYEVYLKELRKNHVEVFQQIKTNSSYTNSLKILVGNAVKNLKFSKEVFPKDNFGEKSIISVFNSASDDSALADILGTDLIGQSVAIINQ